MIERPLSILLVEDNPGDVHLTLEALKSAPAEHMVEVVSDGETAISRLSDVESGEKFPPDLILLDLNLPRRNGHEVLAAVREREATREIPVVVLTSSDRSDDIEESYGLRANCYVTKPGEAGRFMDTIRSISAFWSRQLHDQPKAS